VRRAAPLLGQHTREVLREHGFTNRQIEQMTQQGAIQFPASTKKGTKR
jgi:crotonobetainyl-CoA:carnitine CoA-transferase CaiB-like acyl-CoA transferase